MMITPKRFLFVDWEGGGNLPPVLAVARRLVERGHTVRFLGEPCNAEEIQAAGCHFVSYVHAPHRRTKSPDDDFVRDWEARTPLDAFARNRQRLLFGPASAYAEDVLAELQAHPADVVAINIILYGAMIAAEKAGVPTALLGTSGYPVPTPGLPPPRLGLLPARGPFGRLRDSILGAVIKRLFAQGLPTLNAARSQFGLAPLAHPFQQLEHADQVLLLTSQAFDFQATRLPPNVRYVGPQLEDPAQTQPWSSPWTVDAPDPLVVVSFSTTFQNQGEILQRVIDALGGMRVRALVTLGPTLKQEQFHAPSNVVIRLSAPHAQVFQEAAAVVTHAGYGTVIRALAYGLPLLCIPMGRDQSDNAARVVARGVGLRLAPKVPTSALRQAIQRVLYEPSFLEQAGHLARAIAEEKRRPLAVEALEELAMQRRVHIPLKG